MVHRRPRRYEKGDPKAGGGGRRGGGGKRTQPLEGWEKGDVARQVRVARPDAEIPRKPGRPTTAAEESATHEATAAVGPDLPVLTDLRRVNAKLLTALRKLEGTARPDERTQLLRDVDHHLGAKRDLESRLIPLLDRADVADVLDELEGLDAAIDRHLADLHDSAPDEPVFTLGVHVLHGEVEQQIQRERERLIPAWTESLDPDQAADLALP